MKKLQGGRVLCEAHEIRGGMALDDIALVQESDAIGGAEEASKVMGEVDAGDMHLRAEPVKQLEDGVLQCAIEAGECFIEQEQRRLQHEGAGYGDTLALTTAELRRATRETGGGERDGREHVPDALVDIARRAAAAGVDAEWLGKDLCDREARVEGPDGVLQDELYLRAGREGARRIERRAGEEDLTGIAGFNACKTARECGLAGAGCADDGQRLAGRETEAHLAQDGRGAHGVRPEALGDMCEAQMAHLQQWCSLAVTGERRRRRMRYVRRHVVCEGAGLQTEDTVGDGSEQSRIVTDDEHGGAAQRAHAKQQIEDVALGDGIERGRGLVCEEQRWLRSERLRDGDTLGLTTT